MDATNLINNIYKQEVATLMEQKVLFHAQLEIAKAEIKQKDAKINELETRVTQVITKLNELENGAVIEEVVE